MNEHYFQKGAKQILGLAGYIGGIILLVISAYLGITTKSFDHINLTATGLVLFYLADMMLSSYARMELLLRIIKRQEALHRQSMTQRAPQQPQDPQAFAQAQGFKFVSSEDLINSFNELGIEIQRAIDAEQKGKTINDLSIEELQKMMDEAIKKEDYEKATYIRNVMEQRENGSDSED
ncbi:MAG: UvrB/UvrC motif-containing protein [bacterium]|nr:UvrB/UvrC motif-containing protein [bacterium]